MIETIKPSNPTPTLSPTSFPTFIPATAYPIQKISTPEGSSYPAPVYALTPVPDASPFCDCDRTPGIIACDPTAPRLAGHIAFYDIETNRLIGLDLQTGQGWAVSIPRPMSLEWSPDGSQLLVRTIYSQEPTNIYEYLLFEKGGELIQQFAQDKVFLWQPQGATLRTYEQRKIVIAQDGSEAWLDSSIDRKTLYFRLSGETDWKTAVLDIKPAEWPTALYGWIPGTPNVIITSGSGSVQNDVMLGSYLYMFNTQTGELHLLKGFNGHLDPQFAVFHEPDLAMIQLYYGLANDCPGWYTYTC